MKKMIYFGVMCLVLLSCMGLGSAYKVPVTVHTGIGNTDTATIVCAEVTKVVDVTEVTYEPTIYEPSIEIGFIKPGCCSVPVGVIEMPLEE